MRCCRRCWIGRFGGSCERTAQSECGRGSPFLALVHTLVDVEHAPGGAVEVGNQVIFGLGEALLVGDLVRNDEKLLATLLDGLGAFIKNDVGLLHPEPERLEVAGFDAGEIVLIPTREQRFKHIVGAVTGGRRRRAVGQDRPVASPIRRALGEGGATHVQPDVRFFGAQVEIDAALKHVQHAVDFGRLDQFEDDGAVFGQAENARPEGRVDGVRRFERGEITEHGVAPTWR